MHNLKLPTVQKRFLIIWILLHSFALFINKADIEGLVNPTLSENGQTGYQIHLFTNTWYHDGFWPFVGFIKTEYMASGADYAGNSQTGNVVYFNGLFYCYNLSAFVFYIILGFGIVYIPKLWKEQTVQV
jgi:hypothetical protein